MTRSGAWLLLPFPVLSLGYLFAVRAGTLEPRYAPLIVLAALPAAALVTGVLGLRAAAAGEGGWQIGVVVLAVVELVWAVLALAMVGFAIAWRSG